MGRGYTMKLTTMLLLAAFAGMLTIPASAQADDERAQDAKPVADKTVTIDAGGSTTVTYDGKAFDSLTLTVGNKKLRYKLSRGTEELSSGATGEAIRVRSDGRSTYKLTLTNPTKASVTTKVVGEGGGSDI